jgi:hypothetical protein
MATIHQCWSIFIPKRAQTPSTIKVMIIPSETHPPARKMYSPTFMVKIIIGHQTEQDKSRKDKVSSPPHSDIRPLFMPLRRLLVSIGDAQNGFFFKVLADYLQAYGEAVHKAGGDRDRGHTGNINR